MLALQFFALCQKLFQHDYCIAKLFKVEKLDTRPLFISLTTIIKAVDIEPKVGSIGVGSGY